MPINTGRLSGGNKVADRVENDFYATDPKAVTMLFDALDDPKFGIKYNHDSFMEPSVGNGNIAKTVVARFHPGRCRYIDIVDRGYPGTIVQDFMSYQSDEKFDLIVANPPYSIALDFVQKCRNMLEPNGILAVFLKIQFWEGEKRQKDFYDWPPLRCYPFSLRMHTWNNGNDPSKAAERIRTTMCHAWFVWGGADMTCKDNACLIRPI